MRLIPVKELPKRRLNHKLYNIIKEFVESDNKIVNVEINKEDYKTVKSCRDSFDISIKRTKYPVKVHMCNGKIYLVKYLMEECENRNDDISQSLNDFYWIPVAPGFPLPEFPKYDWVLVRTVLIPDGCEGVPYVAELKNGVWYAQGFDNVPMEKLFSLKVTHWFDMKSIKLFKEKK